MSFTEISAHGSPRRTLVLWALLIAATLLTWRLGEARGGPALVGALLAIAALKGGVVACDFMALKRAGRLWCGLLLGWLALVCGLIALAYWKGLA